MKRAIFIGITAALGVALFQLANVRPALTSADTATEEELADLAVATFAGGCFWCVESTLEKIDGIEQVVSGYTGGHTENPSYYQVGSGETGHTEAVQVYYDPEVIDYEGLLHYFWREIDPTDIKGQFVDRGSMYRPAIYYANDEEKAIALASRDRLEASGRYDKPIALEIGPAQTFYPAEDYHQDYYKTNPLRYKVYRHGSGRDQFLERTWGADLHAKYVPAAVATASAAAPAQSRYTRPDDAVLREMLSDIQYRVTQQDGTEHPFKNEYWDNKTPGIYVDIVSGEPLFSSTDKYRSGTGWPSFSRPIDGNFIVEKTDYKLIYPRTEVRSKYGDSHLGHVFNDGPAPTGLRYCINSASLRFIASNELEEQGYGEYRKLFEQE